MGILREFWHEICEPLDGFLWRRDISHPVIRPILRNQILASGACLLAGGACFALIPWLFWFGAGLLCMTWVFWSWAKFFLRINLGEYSSAFLRAILLRFVARLAVIAVFLYLALAHAQASAAAILAGMITGAALVIVNYALQFLRKVDRRSSS